MSRDIDDISNIVLKPRRIQILRLLLNQGTMRISDLRKVLNAPPVSSIYYDVEILRANGLVIRDGPYVKITSKGRMIIEKIEGGLVSSDQETEDSGKRTEELTNILLMRPLTINMYRLGPNTLLIYSMVIIILGLITAFIQNYELLLLVFVEGMNVMPIGITIISLLATWVLHCLFISTCLVVRLWILSY